MEKNIPLVVDLDGTLIKNDITWDMVVLFVKKYPLLSWIKILLWRFKGKFYLKEKLLSNVGNELEFKNFPFNKTLKQSELLKDREFYIFSGSHEEILNKFKPSIIQNGFNVKEVFGSSQGNNLIGKNKADLIIKTLGAEFDYIGNSSEDIEVWKKARHAYGVNISNRVHRKIKNFRSDFISLETPKKFSDTFKTILNSMRIHQWIKNILIFVILGLNITTITLKDVSQLGLSFLFFSLIASGSYFINDLFDFQEDRNHAKKKDRPVASGDLPINYSFLLAGALITLPLLFGYFIVGLPFLYFSILYLTLTFSYSLLLKRYIILDVLSLSGLFSLRIFMGAAILSKQISVWFIAFVAFFFLSLAIAKRVIELQKGSLAGKTGQLPGRGYFIDDLPIITNFGVITGITSIVVMLVYCLLEKSSVIQSNFVVSALSIVLLWWFLRLYLLIYRNKVSYDPVLFFIKDKASLISFGLLWVLVIGEQLFYSL